MVLFKGLLHQLFRVRVNIIHSSKYIVQIQSSLALNGYIQNTATILKYSQKVSIQTYIWQKYIIDSCFVDTLVNKFRSDNFCFSLVVTKEYNREDHTKNLKNSKNHTTDSNPKQVVFQEILYCRETTFVRDIHYGCDIINGHGAVTRLVWETA